MAERDIWGTRGTLEGHIFCPGARKVPAEILTAPVNFSCFVNHVDQSTISQGEQWLRGTFEGHEGHLRDIFSMLGLGKLLLNSNQAC